MSVQHKQAAVRFAVVGVAIGLVVASCGKEDESSTKSSSASSSAATSAASSASSSATATSTSGAAAPAAADVTALLIKAESIPPTPAGPWKGDPPQADTSSANPSASQAFQSGDRAINALVLLAPDAEQAASSIQRILTSDAVTSQIKGTPAPAPNINKTAMVIDGTSADGSASMAIVLFSEGRAVAQLTFVGKLGDPVTPDYLDTVGVIQLDAIQQNLSKVGG